MFPIAISTLQWGKNGLPRAGKAGGGGSGLKGQANCSAPR